MAEILRITSQGQGSPLVLIHGWGLNSGIWLPMVEKLAKHFEVITVDLPGFGLNVDYSLASYSLINVANAISEAINKPAIYIGWSLGGLVATQIALLAAEKVNALVTIASSPCFVEKSFVEKSFVEKDFVTQDCLEKSSAANKHWPGIKAPLLASFHQQLAQDIPKTLNSFLKIQAMGSPHIRQDIKQISDLVMQYPIPNRVTLDHSLALLETVDLRKQLPNITCPFFRLYGRLDSLVPKTVPVLVSKLVNNSDQHIFPQASHAPFISHPDDFFTVLYQWLQSQRLSKV